MTNEPLARPSPIPWQTCPWCGHSIGGGQHYGPGRLPAVGDWTIAMCCGKPLVLREGLRVERLLPAEVFQGSDKDRTALFRARLHWLAEYASPGAGVLSRQRGGA